MDDFDEYPRYRSQSKRSSRVISDQDMRKVESGVFEYQTLRSVQKLQDGGFLDQLMGPISTGKEADVFLGKLKKDPVAVKIYRPSTAFFKNVSVMQYIRGDERFKNIRHSPRSIVYLWAQKEFKNLAIAQSVKINSPAPIGVEKNIVVMQFIGDGAPAPQLVHCKIKSPKAVMTSVIRQTKKLYEAGLVHADISEYNILMRGEKPYLIDFSQGVLSSHPLADKYLARDAHHISSYLAKHKLLVDEKKILEQIKAA